MYIAHIMWLITAETIPDSANNQYILYPSIKDATNTINKPTTHTQKLTITATLFTFVHLSLIFETFQALITFETFQMLLTQCDTLPTYIITFYSFFVKTFQPYMIKYI